MFGFVDYSNPKVQCLVPNFSFCVGMLSFTCPFADMVAPP